MSAFRRRLLVAAQNKPSGEYTVLEYLQSTGTQYIDTGIVGYDSNNKYDVYCEMAATKSQTAAQMNGWDAGGAFGYYGNKYFDGATSSSGIVTLNKYDYFHFIIKKGTNTASVLYLNGTALLSRNHINLPSYGTFRYTIFATASKSTVSMKMNAKIKYYKIYINDILVRDYIPVIRNADSVVGLFDKCENKFYTNAGTGEFLYG